MMPSYRNSGDWVERLTSVEYVESSCVTFAFRYLEDQTLSKKGTQIQCAEILINTL